MKIVILKTNLFSDNALLEQTVAHFEPEHQIELFDTTKPDLEASDWDNVVKDLLIADRVLTI